MPKREPTKVTRRRKSRAMTPDEREAELINLSLDLVEQRLRDGTATAAETVHFLKLASSRDREERATMRQKRELEAEKTRVLRSQTSAEERYTDALNAFRKYSGHSDFEDDDEDDDDY